MKFHLLAEADVRSVLSIEDLLEPLEQALAAFSSGEVVQPVRAVVPVAAGPGFFGSMPACLPFLHAVGTKLVTLFASNARAGLPTHLATIVLLDEHTGGLRAVMDGRYITEIRTAAASAVAARHLARADASRLAILGTGVQARSHILAMPAVREVRSARVWSPNPEHRARFVAEMQPRLPFPVTACDGPEECVREADLIVAATSSRTPVVASGTVRDGAHVTAVGACRPDERELDPLLVRRGRLFVDSRDAAIEESGDVLMSADDDGPAKDRIAAEIGEVIAGRAAGRRDEDEVTIFKSLGLAVEDLAAAHLVWTRAVNRGIGRVVEL